MFKLPNSLKSWGTRQFESIFKQELSMLEPQDFGLEKDISYSGFFVENSLNFSVLTSTKDKNKITVTLGVYYQEYMTTCPCSGDETEIFNGY